ncbi:hypothetical protein BY996DRAFT_6415382 [Phakopsora pachyrhizi]|nr:hypothetical protein BY996DRAFT_6415382 [Phakopsora pachyrhizi]
MCRKSSQQNDSTDFEPQSDLITASPNVGIGTRPVEKPSGPALVDKIGLNYQNDVSEIGAASDEMCIYVLLVRVLPALVRITFVKHFELLTGSSQSIWDELSLQR